jgi:Phage integrase, N-terminal SAM-like domain
MVAFHASTTSVSVSPPTLWSAGIGRVQTCKPSSIARRLYGPRLNPDDLLLSAFYRTAGRVCQCSIRQKLWIADPAIRQKGSPPMKQSRPTTLALLLREFFASHLPNVRGMSPHTIKSYQDSLALLLRFVAEYRKRSLRALIWKISSLGRLSPFRPT